MGTGEYFLAILPDGTRLVQTISGALRHPIPFGREAAAELAGVPDRADWKSCQASAIANYREICRNSLSLIWKATLGKVQISYDSKQSKVQIDFHRE